MTPTQTQEFLDKGVITLDMPLSSTEIAAINEALDRLMPLPAPRPDGSQPYRVQLDGFLEPILVDLIQHPFLEETAKQALNADSVRFFQSAMTMAYPQPNTPWGFDQHVDIQYRASDFQATPRRIVCSFFMWLTDVNERRAPMMFRPGSHLLLAEENERRAARHGDVQAVRPMGLAQLPPLDYADPLPLLARAGQVSVCTTSAVHGASVNVDDSPRKGVVITFIAPGTEIGLPADQAERKREYDRTLSAMFRPDRRHLLDV